MIKIAILDDYQNIFHQIIDIDNYKSKYFFKIFNNSFENEIETVEALKEFEVLFLMRERTPITKSILNELPNLKFIITSGMRNNSIDVKAANKKKHYCYWNRNKP